jgi:hypothetical protein
LDESDELLNVVGSTMNLAIQFLVIGSLLLSLYIIVGKVQFAFSDGLFQENLPPATVGDRQASLFTKVSPPILTSDTIENRFFELRLYDAKTGDNISNVNYFLTVTKAEKLLMRDLFYSKLGPLKIQIIPRQGPVTVYGSAEPFLSGWMSETGEITVQGPILLDGGLYHFAIEIFGIDSPRNIFTPESAPKFDSYLSIGEVHKANIKYDEIVYNTTLISYYDKIHSFNFDPTNLVVSWAMPFDWNLSRIEGANKFVHEELRIPKNFSQIGNNTSFTATVNEQPVLGRSLAIDPFSSENALIIHYLLTKSDLIKFAESSNVTADSNNTRKFTLAPGESELMQTSTDLLTDTGGIRLALLWEPNPPTTGSEATLTLNFSDALTDSSLRADVNYNLTILDSVGKEITIKENLVAANGTDNQNLIFPESSRYQIEVHVKSLMTENKTTVESPPNEVARGLVAVFE